MATELWITQCCAVLEIKNISDSPTSEEAFKAVYQHLVDTGAKSYLKKHDGTIVVYEREVKFERPFILFTGTVGPDASRLFGHPEQKRFSNYSEDFRDFIQKYGMGPVIETAPGKNFTENLVKVYVWQPDYEKVKLVYEALTQVKV